MCTIIYRDDCFTVLTPVDRDFGPLTKSSADDRTTERSYFGYNANAGIISRYEIKVSNFLFTVVFTFMVCWIHFLDHCCLAAFFSRRDNATKRQILVYVFALFLQHN